MPLPVAEEGIAGFLQRSENRRISVSPNDSPGTAKRKGKILPLTQVLRPLTIGREVLYFRLSLFFVQAACPAGGAVPRAAAGIAAGAAAFSHFPNMPQREKHGSGKEHKKDNIHCVHFPSLLRLHRSAGRSGVPAAPQPRQQHTARAPHTAPIFLRVLS